MKVGKKHRLIWWLGVITGILLCAFSAFFLRFGIASIENLTGQEIENRSALLKLNIGYVNQSLD